MIVCCLTHMQVPFKLMSAAPLNEFTPSLNNPPPALPPCRRRMAQSRSRQRPPEQQQATAAGAAAAAACSAAGCSCACLGRRRQQVAAVTARATGCELQRAPARHCSQRPTSCPMKVNSLLFFPFAVRLAALFFTPAPPLPPPCRWPTGGGWQADLLLFKWLSDSSMSRPCTRLCT